MKKQSFYAAGASFVYSLSVLGMPMAVHAISESPIVIAEVQQGSAASASEEFIEIANISDNQIDLDANHWQIITASASAKDWAPYRTASLHGTLAPGASYVVASTYTSNGQSIHYLPLDADAEFTAGLSAAGGHVRLTYSVNAMLADGTCGPSDVVADTVEWSTITNGNYNSPSITGRTPFGTTSRSGIPSSSTLQRMFDDINKTYADTDNDAADFTLLPATPGLPNVPMSLSQSVFNLLPIAPMADNCDPTQPEPSPGTGPTESTDTTPPPSDGVPVGTGPDDGDTDGSANVPPADTAGTPDPVAAQEPPIISEALPNPAAPLTDAKDEFIELYNPNDTSMDIAGYTLEAGGGTMRRYVFPAGTVLGPHAYSAYYAATTGLSLPNSGGTIRLLDSSGGVVASTPAYGAAEDGRAWALYNGTWQWTTTPTAGMGNIMTAPAIAAKKASVPAKSATKKAAAVKAATTAKPKAAAKKSAQKPKKAAVQKTQLSPVAAAVRNPIHTGVLAAIGVFALLYGAYEYRHDVANKINQFRSNRAARRAARQAAARR